MDADTQGRPGTYEQPTVVELGDVAELTADKATARPDGLSGAPEGDFSPPIQ
jgi:hypothetical protein